MPFADCISMLHICVFSEDVLDRSANYSLVNLAVSFQKLVGNAQPRGVSMHTYPRSRVCLTVLTGSVRFIYCRARSNSHELF